MTDFSYGNKLRLAIEYYIAQLPEKKQANAWQQLPYLVQFWPILVKYGKYLPDIRRVNMGIKYGGLTEYDKSIIYNKIPKQFILKAKDLNQKTMPSWERLEENILLELQFPLMVKAQVGERGVGVYYMEDKKSLQKHWQKLDIWELKRHPCSLQRFSSCKNEYCLQFYQYHDQAGIHRILFGGLTLRDVPVVVGDDVCTIREHVKYLDISETQQQRIIDKLEDIKPWYIDSIPSKGNHEQIVYIASIDYGTVYRQIDLDVEQIEQCIEILRQLLQNMSPEYLSVGRFDLKANSVEELLTGKLDVIECNAGWGIPTHVYAENFSIQQKYKELDQHFVIMGNIAQVHKGKYAKIFQKVLSWPEFLYISYKSIAKKWINVFEKQNSQMNELMDIYKDIFRILRLSRFARWKMRLKRMFIGF